MTKKRSRSFWTRSINCVVGVGLDQGRLGQDQIRLGYQQIRVRLGQDQIRVGYLSSDQGRLGYHQIRVVQFRISLERAYRVQLREGLQGSAFRVQLRVQVRLAQRGFTGFSLEKVDRVQLREGLQGLAFRVQGLKGLVQLRCRFSLAEDKVQFS